MGLDGLQVHLGHNDASECKREKKIWTEKPVNLGPRSASLSFELHSHQAYRWSPPPWEVYEFLVSSPAFPSHPITTVICPITPGARADKRTCFSWPFPAIFLLLVYKYNLPIILPHGLRFAPHFGDVFNAQRQWQSQSRSQSKFRRC